MKFCRVRVHRDKPECFRHEWVCPDCRYCLDPIPELIDHGSPLWVEISTDFPGNANYRQWGPRIPSLACQVFGWSEFIFMVPRDFQNWIEQQRPDDWERLTRDDVEQLLRTAIQQRNDEQVDVFVHQQVQEQQVQEQQVQEQDAIVGLDSKDILILETMAKRPGYLWPQIEIETESGLTRKTIGNRMPALLEAGFVRQPRGPQGGVQITNCGLGRVKPPPAQ
jgi:hypothetical protein